MLSGMHGRRSESNRALACWIAAAAGLLTAASALAQSGSYRLGDDRRWSASAPAPEPGSDAAIIADARRLLAEDNPEAARDILDPWLERTEREANPYRPEALLLRGDCLVALEREYKSLYDYEEIIRKHRESEQFPIAVERELDIAIRYANGLKIRVLGMRIGDSEEVAEELFIRVQERMPRSQLAERASIEMADFYYRQRDMKMAFQAYDLYLTNFPSGPSAMHARERRIQADIARFKGPKYNASELINARTRIREFVDRYPAEADASGMDESMVARLDESMAAHLLDTAQWYLRSGDPTSSRFTLRRLLRDFPATLSAQRGEEMLREQGWADDIVPLTTEEGTPVENMPSDPAQGSAPAQNPEEAPPLEPEIVPPATEPQAPREPGR